MLKYIVVSHWKCPGGFFKIGGDSVEGEEKGAGTGTVELLISR